MDRTPLLKRSAGYALGWIVSALVGLAIVAVGADQWVIPAYLSFVDGAPLDAVLRTATPGLLLVLLGAFVWQVGSTAARYWTLTAAFSAETAEILDTEAMKSDILSVMDERLADLKQDTQRTRRIVERMGSEEAAESFEFADEP